VFVVSLRVLRVFVVSFALVPSWQRGVGGVQQQPERGDVERGRQTFVRVGCYQCHGREAQGASTGPRLGPNPLPLAAFTRAVRTPRNEMPPYSVKLLSDADLADVHAFAAARPAPHQLPR
jgi:ubiquinol-cytochrome c reductase cytochrome c subunit